VGEGCVLLGEKIGHEPILLKQLYYAGMIHDIGKISIDIGLLSKKGKLSPEEFEKVKKHTIYGSRIVASLPELRNLAYWVRWHHERWDGKGYPDGLAGDEIPIEVQILSAVDCYDSLQTPRMDRNALLPDEALAIIEQGRGTFFNPRILDLLLEMHQEKTLVSGKSSEKFLELKDKYLALPLVEVSGDYLKYYNIKNLFPILKLFARAIDAKHHDTSGHSNRVSVLARYLAGEMGLSLEDQVKVEIAGLLHDAGKVSIPNDVLNKKELPNREEWELIKHHPVYSSELLKKITPFKDISDIVYNHHVWLDGRGYPSNAQNDNILTHIISVADAYDAITSTRSYRKAKSSEEAYKLIKGKLGTQFNVEVGNILLKTPSKYITALFDMNLEDY
jgi:putative nucleotidyltransferase with HDIG domain